MQPNTHATQIWCARCSTSHGQLYNDALLAATPTAAGARALGSVPRPSVLHTVAIARSYISRRAERSRATYVASFSLGRHRSDAGRTSNAGQPTIPPRGLKPRTLTEAHQSSEHSAIIGALRLINHRSTRSSHRRRHRRWPRPWKPLDHTFRHTLRERESRDGTWGVQPRNAHLLLTSTRMRNARPLAGPCLPRSRRARYLLPGLPILTLRTALPSHTATPAAHATLDRQYRSPLLYLLSCLCTAPAHA